MDLLLIKNFHLFSFIHLLNYFHETCESEYKTTSKQSNSYMTPVMLTLLLKYLAKLYLVVINTWVCHRQIQHNIHKQYKQKQNNYRKMRGLLAEIAFIDRNISTAQLQAMIVSYLFQYSHNLAVECRSSMATNFIYINLCLIVKLDNLSCSFTS